MFGYGGLRIKLDRLTFHPRLPPNTTKMTLTGLNYLGATFDVLVTTQRVIVVVRETDEKFQLQLRTLDVGNVWNLKKGTSTFFIFF